MRRLVPATAVMTVACGGAASGGRDAAADAPGETGADPGPGADADLVPEPDRGADPEPGDLAADPQPGDLPLLPGKTCATPAGDKCALPAPDGAVRASYRKDSCVPKHRYNEDFSELSVSGGRLHVAAVPARAFVPAATHDVRAAVSASRAN